MVRFPNLPISNTRRFFFFLKISKASGSKLGANTISINTEVMASATALEQVRLKAIIPPKAERESALKARVYTSRRSFPTATPQGLECLITTQAGCSNSRTQAKAPSASIMLLYESFLPW